MCKTHQFNDIEENAKRKKISQLPQRQGWVPGGDIVLSSTEGIVISMTGLRDGIPLAESWQAEWISSILKR